MSDFSFDELKRLIKEQLGERFPERLTEAEKTPPPKGLLELRKIAVLQRTFSPKEKASALSKFAGEANDNPWVVLTQLKKNVELHSQQAMTADCPDDLIQNVVTLASFADLLFSERTGQAKGWFMEEWVAEATGGKVIPAGSGESIQGTADIETRSGDLWSIKLTMDTKIGGSRTEFLNGLGYVLDEEASNETHSVFNRRGEPEKQVNYLFFKKSKSSVYELEILEILGEQIYKNIFTEIVGTETPEDTLTIPVESLTGDLGSIVNYRKTVDNQMVIEFKLEEDIQFANSAAQAMFEEFNAIVKTFDVLIGGMTDFYGEPNPQNQQAATEATKQVGDAVNKFQTSCTPEKTT